VRTSGIGARAATTTAIAKARKPPSLVVYGHDDERRVLSGVTAIGGRREDSLAAERRGPAFRGAPTSLLRSQLDLLGDAEHVIDLDAEVANRAFELRVPEEQLDE
jgi:hypothetical protein